MKTETNRKQRQQMVLDYHAAKQANDKKQIRILKNKIVIEYANYCNNRAFPFASQKPDLRDDLRQASIMGMLIALDRFSPEKSNGAHFETFAYKHITEHIVDCFNDSQEIKISDARRRFIPTIVRFWKKYHAEHNKFPDFKLVSDETNIDIKDIIAIIGTYYSKHTSVSMESCIGESDDLNFSDVIEDKDLISCEDQYNKDLNVTTEAFAHFKKLNTNQMNVFFYIHTTNSKIKDAAKVLGLGYERCRQLNKEALDIAMPNCDSFFANKYLRA